MKTFLALGDSYTIGEAVLITETFGYQTTAKLREAGMQISAPEIVAKTGYTTDELQKNIEQHNLLENYDVVSLLIGVNNQYRGRTIEDFKPEFEALLQFAINKASNNANAVFVLSIPDWGITPFAKERDAAIIASEIDAYNLTCKEIALRHACHFIDITEPLRQLKHDETMVATDGLHPSATAYAIWANLLANKIMEQIKR
jgi:lysophospholipase L1-like esterase